ncbi:MAG TPA: SRPBCC domain-containing protein [Candidatus Saccharimonadales bacterium]|nr:SRPBCC domain-containing protein [Candidatus Saccharimonadales bacterium]
MGAEGTRPKVIHATCVVERSLSKPPEVVFAALSEPGKVREWYGAGDHHDLVEFALRFAIGGTQRLSYRFKPGHPIAGKVLVNDGVFQEIVPGERIVTASTMEIDGKRISASLVTFELVPTRRGTDLICTHQGAFFEGAGPEPAKMREAGWNTLMDRIVNLVAAATEAA